MVMWCGIDMIEYLLCVFVMFVGEDVLVCSLFGKLVCMMLIGKCGLLLFDDLLCFLVW